LVLLALVAIAVAAGREVRQQAGFEPSVESIQAWVGALGWRGPAVFLGLVTFRLFLFLPSFVILTAGGLLFGVALGTLLGGAGVLASAILGFALARGIGSMWLRHHLMRRFGGDQAGVERAGPLLVAAATAHPVGPMSAFHWGAGLSGLSLWSFVVVVAVAGPMRAAILSVFGSTLADVGSWQFALATAALALLALTPLLHPGVRRRLRRRSPLAAIEADLHGAHAVPKSWPPDAIRRGPAPAPVRVPADDRIP
jgi:uncharacterized membrane protein YdjX (TVP38/TMEM64 family)